MDTSQLPKLPLSKPMPSAPDIPLHDIKPLVEISDYSLYYLSALIVVGVVIVLALFFFVWKYWNQKNAKTTRKEHYKYLQTIDFTDSKMAAYAITKYAYTFSNDGERQQEAYQNLLSRLAPYKYKKSVDAIDDEAKGYFDIYLGMIDV
ncbi:MAG: hypothetical protein U9R50_06855 [Campylobacterota bacterium]|nr:hypothetical protein [Campylobacterota bacterium]